MIGRPKNTPATFWRKVDVRGPDECWVWRHSLKGGYGNHCVNCVTWCAHAYAYFITHGVKSSRQQQVMHTCNNKACCNPKHLVLGTPSQNTLDAYRDGLAKAGERHYKAKFSAELIEKIKSDPRPQLVLEREYGVSQQHISRIKNGLSRKYEGVNG